MKYCVVLLLLVCAIQCDKEKDCGEALYKRPNPMIIKGQASKNINPEFALIDFVISVVR